MQGVWGALVRSLRGHKVERGTSPVRMSEMRPPRVSGHSEMLAPHSVPESKAECASRLPSASSLDWSPRTQDLGDLGPSKSQIHVK